MGTWRYEMFWGNSPEQLAQKVTRFLNEEGLQPKDVVSIYSAVRTSEFGLSERCWSILAIFTPKK